MSLASPKSVPVNGAALRFGMVAARFNERLVDGLLARVLEELRLAKVKTANVEVVRVPGSHEIPWAANIAAISRKCDCVIALGVLIAGDTNHHEMVGESVSHALQRIAIDTRIPVINGVIVANSLAQAEARCLGKINRSAEFAAAGLEMALLRRKLSR
jgi:6,7-dimethyl-8-ribityllumazine synthase